MTQRDRIAPVRLTDGADVPPTVGVSPTTAFCDVTSWG